MGDSRCHFGKAGMTAYLKKLGIFFGNYPSALFVALFQTCNLVCEFFVEFVGIVELPDETEKSLLIFDGQDVEGKYNQQSRRGNEVNCIGIKERQDDINAGKHLHGNKESGRYIQVNDGK
jgi:hypothetical protein